MVKRRPKVLRLTKAQQERLALSWALFDREVENGRFWFYERIGYPAHTYHLEDLDGRRNDGYNFVVLGI